MTLGNGATAALARFLALSTGLMVLAGCGGSTGSTTTTTSGKTTVSNSQALQVNLGPANNYVDGVFTSVTICVPGSSNCQTIDNIAVDTGSEGLRLLSSQVTLSLPQANANGSALHECISFADGSYLWGPVATADVQMAGEKATSVPVQIISSSPSIPAPSDCTSGGGPNENTVASLGANGLLGIGNFQQDCGAACAGPKQPPALYYVCTNSSCQTTTVPLASQAQNPVWLFPKDNNGVLISLPSVPVGGAASVSGSLIFGVGTESNNTLGSAKIYTTDGQGNFTTSYNGTSYNQSYIDSGSNGLFFLDNGTLGITECSDNQGFYCPASTVNYTATNTGLNGVSGPISFSIENADTLFNTGFAAFDDLGGDNTGSFDWGLPFFFGRSVFVGIEGQAGPNGSVGPYWAY